MNEKFKELRLKLGLSQRKLGEIIGRHHSAMHNYEVRKRKISPEVLKKFIEYANSKGMKIDYNYFYDND